MPPAPVVLPFPIPDSILLLVHLHLLKCDLQLDPNMFNPNTCGIGDRIKNMEHVVYFLIDKAEGPQRTKVLLSMYPSKKPADGVSFRNAVVKYLEGIRAAALKPQSSKRITNPKVAIRPSGNEDMAKKRVPSSKRPLPSVRSTSATVSSRSGSSLSNMHSKAPSNSRSVSVGTQKTSTSNSQGQDPKPISKAATSTNSKQMKDSEPTPLYGWWWKDVLVRKSLLEECTGPRFERLLLALSIHVLLLQATRTNLGGVSHNNASLELDNASNLDMFNMLCEQPDDYRDLIQRMTSLQIRLSGEEQNLARQRQLIRSLKTSIASKIPSENHDEPSLQALQAQVSELVSKLDPSWQVALDLERASSVSPNAQPEAGDDTTILHWSLAIAGTSRQLYNENDDKSNKDLQLTNTKGTRKSMGNRKTILPAPPLPTVAANYASHLEILSAAKSKVSQLQVAQLSSQEEENFAEQTSIQETRPLEPKSLAYESLDGQANEFSDSVQRFIDEMAELEERLERELEIKQNLLAEAYREDVTHGDQWYSELLKPSEEFKLDFEMQNDDHVPSVLSRFNQAAHYSDIADSILKAIEDSIDEASNSLEQGEPQEWDESDGTEQPYDSGASMGSDDDLANQTVIAGGTTSPLKITRTPTSSRTPKRDMSIAQPWSSVKRQPLQQDSKMSAKKTEPSTPPYKTNQRILEETPTSVSFLRTPPGHLKQRIQATPSRTMATPSFFYSPGDGMEDLRDIIPPFQSPWRSVSRVQKSPRKSGRMSSGKPNRPRPSKGRLASSTSFVRTPLKSGKRLSNILPPVTFPLAKFGQATPRASLDDVYEEIVDDLVKSTSLRTPPSSTSARRLLDSNNNVQRSSPFKSLTKSGRAPRSPQSPDIGFQITEEAENDGQEMELSFGTAMPLGSRHLDEWEDVLEEAYATSTTRRRPVLSNTKPAPRFSEGPSFTLRDMLLKVGQDGMLGANGTFNFDLLQESEVDVDNDSIFYDT